jgi:hypothetical protein
MALAAPRIIEDEYSYDADNTAPNDGRAVRSRARRISSSTTGSSSTRTARNAGRSSRVLDTQRDLLDDSDSPVAQEAARRLARSRARRAHKPFRLSLPTTAMGIALMAQLMALLWIKSLALSAMHRSVALGDATHGQIGRVNEDIAQTQKKIAGLSSPAQIKKWADQRGWRLATPEQFDDVTKLTPLPKPAASESSAAPTEGASTDGR